MSGQHERLTILRLRQGRDRRRARSLFTSVQRLEDRTLLAVAPFSPPLVAAVGSHPVAVVTSDFNGDGKLDVATVNSGDNTVSVLMGNGAGGFATAVSYAVGTGPDALAVGDFNGDGSPDLVVANATAGTLSVLMNNGHGVFTNTTTLPLNNGSSSYPTSLIVGDFNGDGHLDIAVNDYNAVDIFSGNGQGGFSAPLVIRPTSGLVPNALVAGDFNGDGKLDLAIQSTSQAQLEILTNNGQGGFTQGTPFSTGSNPTALVAADLNGDGKLDLVSSSDYSNQINVFLANTGGGFSRSTIALSSNGVNLDAATILPADLENDGRPDLIVGGSNTAVSVLRNQGNGQFGAPVFYNDYPAALTVGDFNGDGLPDVVGANEYGNSTRVYLNEGSGRLALPTFTYLPTSSSSEAVADFNGDGKTDVVVNNYGATAANSLSELLNNGSGGFQAPVMIAGVADPILVQAADMNGDGKPDIVEAGYASSTSTIAVLLGDGHGGFTESSSFTVPGKVNSFVIGDFNGDGKPDLAASVGTDGAASLVVALGNGAGGFTSVTTTSVPYGGLIAAGDFNGDGKADLVIGDTGSFPDVLVLKGDGSGGFSTLTTFTTAGLVDGLVVADFNGDGKPDIATLTGSSGFAGAVNLYTNLGTVNNVTKFSSASSTAVGTSPESLVSADFNGDGNLDLVATFSSSPNSGVFLAGDGHGDFTTTTFDAGSVGYPGNSAAGDVNGDGTPDLITANGGISVVTTNTNNAVRLAATAPATATAGTAVALTVTADNSSGQPSSNYVGTVHFTSTDPNAVLPADYTFTAADAGSHTFSVILKTAATESITVTGGTFTATSAVAVSAAAPATVVTTAGTPQSALTGQPFAVNLQALVEDAYGNPVAGASVVFAAPASGAGAAFPGGSLSATALTNANGYATAPTLTSNATVGGYSVTATVAGAGTPATFQLSNKTSLAGISQTTGGGQTAIVHTTFANALVATVVDASGNPLPGAVVTFSPPNPSGTTAVGYFNGYAAGVPVTVTTDSNGNATSPPLVAGLYAGNFTVTATVTVGGVPYSATYSLVNSPTAPSLFLATAGDQQGTPAGSVFGTALQATLLDTYGNPIPNTSATFTVTPGYVGATFAGGAKSVVVVTNSAGVATAPTLTANSVGGVFVSLQPNSVDLAI